MTEAWVGLGSNLGHREGYLRAALAGLAGLGEVVCVSPVYETAPVGFLDQGAFLNAVACIRTALPAAEFMAGLQALERAGGRVRAMANGPRTIDLDLLFWGAEVVETEGLVVPHPRLHERAFVLAPLSDVAPGLVHPRLGKTVRELLSELGSLDGVVRQADSGADQ
ncbi:MAG: 2-amino-4-hydroxy-6-hydroxymethyldihydropteridine diphosphokinase [Acidobacteria bacterium]|nr:2-amino-4-hydroxy-6-hydroxymethyldihydropteridine diphosphokinase [Acidobacteriota bacterium]